MSELKVLWRELYRRALLELDPRKLFECIDAAEMRIRTEREHLPCVTDNGHDAERQAMDDALYSLSSLRRTALRNLRQIEADETSRT